MGMSEDRFEVKRRTSTSMALRCELVARKNRLAWKWSVATDLMLDDGVEFVDMAVARDFAVYLTSTGKLLQCGEMSRQVSYDQFLLRPGRRRSRAHAIGTQVKRLSTRERERQAGHVCDSNCCPLQVPAREQIKVQQVACGATHCVVLGQVGGPDGEQRGLFAWGIGEYGQLGLGGDQTASTLTPITACQELQTLFQKSDDNHRFILRCGAFSTYLLSRGSSTLWHWGLLPSAKKEQPFVRQGVPVKFPLIDENTRLVDVAVGVEHIVLLSESGCVFTWGYGPSGQLGLGPSTTSNVDYEHLSEVDFFHQETNHSVVAISCGWNHTVAVSRSGEVYAWGSNSSGACGAKSKFCEYFQPVLVAVPRPVELGLISLDLQAEVRCAGNTSVLLLRRLLNDTYSSIERAFKWGIGSSAIGGLLPVELFSFGIKQSKFASCSIGFGSSIWLFCTGASSSEREPPPGWIVNEIIARAASHQTIEEGLPSLQICKGVHTCVRVQAITKTAAAAAATLPESDGLDPAIFSVNLQRDDSSMTSGEELYNAQACVSILSVTQNNGAHRNSSVDIVLLAQSVKKTIVSLGSVTGEIIGGMFEVDIVPQNENEAEMNENQDSTIRILGVHVEGTVDENLERVDADWHKPHSKHIRVYTDDMIVVLIESVINDFDPAIQVEFRDNQWQYGLTHLDVISNEGQNLGVVQLRFPSPGVYSIYDTKHYTEDKNDDRSPMLTVSCCLSRQERIQVLTENHATIQSKYQFALEKARPSAQFSFFLSLVLQHPTLRDAVVSSPWTSTYDVDCYELPLDFDRESNTQQELLQHPECPFILWDPYVATSSKSERLEQPPHQNEGSPSLDSILPPWAEPVASKVAFRIATWLEKPNIGPKEKPNNTSIDYEKARLSAATTGLSVQQIPFDFLGSLGQRAVREALAPVNPNIVGVHDSIVSWRRTNGDVFYTVQSDELRVRRYGHESHDFPETAQSGRITRLKAQLSDFLWQAVDGKKIQDLFFLLTRRTEPKLHQVEGCSLKNEIHLRELIMHSTALGFDEVVAVLKQEWFALFRSIQAMSSSDTTGISFCTFRTFLIDPFHQFFWKQYVHRLREQANSSREMVAFALVQSFGQREKDDYREHCDNNDGDCSETSNTYNGEGFRTPWTNFVESLGNFHGILGIKPLLPPDCCRLLYRFDTFGDGQISTQTFQNAILHALDEIAATSQDFRNSNPNKSPTSKRPLKVAISNGHRRPNVELFTSSEAVHKLFAARAKTCLDLKSSSTALPGNSRATNSKRIIDVAATLRGSANTHLARIRNLPVSHLLREGIFFRPPREALYLCKDEKDRTQAQAMGAEDSY